MNKISITDYDQQLFPEIERLWALTGMGGAERGDDKDTILRSLETGGRLLVMTDNATGDLVGTSWMTFDGRRIHLHHFAIHPYYQGRGLAKVLLNASLGHIKEKGYQVKLEVHSSNLKAIKLYTKAGFKYLGDYDVYIIRNPDTIDPG